MPSRDRSGASWRTRAWTLPVFFLTAIGGEKLTYLVTSVVVGRPRPPVPAVGVVHATTSFPSGHVGSAIVLYGGLVRFSRLYRGHHYLSDVVWGALLGVVWLAVAWSLVLRRISARGRSSTPPRGSPATR